MRARKWLWYLAITVLNGTILVSAATVYRMRGMRITSSHYGVGWLLPPIVGAALCAVLPLMILKRSSMKGWKFRAFSAVTGIGYVCLVVIAAEGLSLITEAPQLLQQDANPFALILKTLLAVCLVVWSKCWFSLILWLPVSIAVGSVLGLVNGLLIRRIFPPHTA